MMIGIITHRKSTTLLIARGEVRRRSDTLSYFVLTSKNLNDDGGVSKNAAISLDVEIP